MELAGAKAESISHLGLVAATIQEMGVMEKIDEQLGIVEGGVRFGQRVGAGIKWLGIYEYVIVYDPTVFL